MGKISEHLSMWLKLEGAFMVEGKSEGFWREDKGLWVEISRGVSENRSVMWIWTLKSSSLEAFSLAFALCTLDSLDTIASGSPGIKELLDARFLADCWKN